MVLSLATFTQAPRHLYGAAVLVYQRTLSPDHGWNKIFFPAGYCRFTPSCSEYSRHAVYTHGLIGGLLLTAARLVRCAPWSAGGADPVPPRLAHLS